MNLVDTVSLRAIATAEYADIVVGVLLPGTNELRIFITDGSFVDVPKMHCDSFWSLYGIESLF